MRFRIVAGALAGFVALGAALAGGTGTADARDDRAEVLKNGSCTVNTDWKLKVKEDDSALEVEFEVDQNVVGARWRVTLRNDGERFFQAVRTTVRPSGSFSVETRTADGAGKDRITARAVNLASGEVCSAAARI